MISELDDLIDAFPGEPNQTRCFLHILNLVVKSVLRRFDPPKAGISADGDDEAAREIEALAEDLEDTEDETSTNDSEIDEDNVEGLQDERVRMTEDEIRELEASVLPVRLVLTKLRKVAFTIKNSTTVILPQWFLTLNELSLVPRMMPRDVSTRWNSTFDMVDFALDYKPAINAITAKREMKMRQYELDNKEWTIAKELRDILVIFKDATLFFSRGTPSISMVIPAMDHIDEHLATAAKNRKLSPSIRAALAIGKRTLNRYYNKTDHSEVYRIAMVLHPCHKLVYFKNAGWEEEWINTTRDIVRAEYDHTYAFMDTLELSENTATSTTSQSLNIFDNLPALTAPTTRELRDELERYLSTDPEHVTDPFAWWYERRTMYPHLHRMALDYLCIPATSVDVERVFSQGRLLLSHVRSRLSVQSTRALICLGCWSNLGYVKDADVKAVTVLPEVPAGEEEEELAAGWDAIKLD
ncbi:hypothetical protein NLJ89_g2860 [Agrocybe chaxingu]|uniref:HAT C-terminal dimerisation domain-containing protein n=1 Tax=Agrocybe chaxingu TaxID=84603 RepID=A0A9W8K5S3_9AGAR|nr:hypothetical protein NLJ89_g2860 [Agrocybe chaxingu]